MSKQIVLGLIEGFHPFQVPPFHELFRSLDGIDYYPQTIENWAFNLDEYRQYYHVLLFYNMNMEYPKEEAFKEKVQSALESMTVGPRGIIFLHHALLAYPFHDRLSSLIGIKDRTFQFYLDQDVKLHVADTEHPITTGLSDWEMHDETYTMNGPSCDHTALLMTDHPKSMRTLAWCREIDANRINVGATNRNLTRIVCIQPGHDQKAWQNLSFRRFLRNSIRWAAGEA